MHRIDSSTAEANKFGAGKDGFTEGTPGVDAATETTEDWYDGVQEEIISPIEAVNISLAKGTRSQLLDAIKKLSRMDAICNLTQQDNPINFLLQAVTHDSSDRAIVAVGETDGGDAYIARSVDEMGQVWVEAANPKNFDLWSIANNGAGLWVAVGSADGVDAYIVTSTDTGSTWTERANPKNFGLLGVHHHSGLWVAVGDADGVDAYIVTSPDGITWTEQANPKNFLLYDVFHDGAGLWVAVGDTDGVDAYIVTSPDGITWTEQANPKNIVLKCVTYGNGLWVAAGSSDGGDTYLVTSPDGSVWTERSNPTTVFGSIGDARAITYANGIYAIVGEASSGPFFITSVDGITWIEHEIPAQDPLNGIAFCDRMWCIVGEVDVTPTRTILLTSAKTYF